MQIEALYTIDAKTLLQTNLQPVQYVIENMLPKGLTILAGSPKVGKSWLVLDMCDKIAKGEPLWGFNTMQGTTLYLCLEDTYNRIQTRLECMTENASEQTFFATIINDLSSGFYEQIAGFIKQHPETVLVVVDTFQKIRSKTIDRNIYASEYDEANKIKAIADKLNIAIMLVHHTRKLADNDPFNTISGSTGIIGACDGIMVLNKENRLLNRAKLNITGRDIEDRDLILI
jgi:RecA-family ATPase